MAYTIAAARGERGVRHGGRARPTRGATRASRVTTAPRCRSCGRRSSPARPSPDIEWVEDTAETLKAEGRGYDCFSILRPTSPFRTAETIQRAWGEFLAEQGVDSLRAVEKVHAASRQDVGGAGEAHAAADAARTRGAALAQQPDGRRCPRCYVQNASLEIAWTRVVFDGHTIAGVSVMPFFTDEAEGFDINEPVRLATTPRRWWREASSPCPRSRRLPSLRPSRARDVFWVS